MVCLARDAQDGVPCSRWCQDGALMVPRWCALMVLKMGALLKMCKQSPSPSQSQHSPPRTMFQQPFCIRHHDTLCPGKGQWKAKCFFSSPKGTCSTAECPDAPAKHNMHNPLLFNINVCIIAVGHTLYYVTSMRASLQVVNLETMDSKVPRIDVYDHSQVTLLACTSAYYNIILD
jgi:hypothetical protein